MISQKILKEILDYDPETGIFIWKARVAKKTKVGSVAGCKGPNNSIQIGFDYQLYPAHRLAWLYVYGDLPDEYDIIHINYKNDDNRIENLRCTTKVARLVR